MNVYAKIDMTTPGSGTGTIVQTLEMNPGDSRDSNFSWTDITSYNPRPGIGWTTTDLVNFNSNAPTLTPLQILEAQAPGYIDFGSNLYDQITAQVWAINELASQNGSPLTQSQLLTLLSESTSLQQCLQSGSLVTAQAVITELVASFPQYSTVGTWATAQINTFLGS